MAPRHLLGGILVMLQTVLPSGLSAGATGADSGFAIRGVLPWHNFLSGPSAWNLAEYERYLDECRDRGINFIGFHNYTGGGQRYVSYVEPMIRIVHKNVVPVAFLDNSLTARWGYTPRAVRDFAFGTGRLYGGDSAAFGADCSVRSLTTEEHYRNTQGLMRRVMAMAREHGMQTAMGFEFGVHPPELLSLYEEGLYWEGTGGMIPNPTQYQAAEILHAAIDDILAAYPDVDWIWLWLNEHSFFGFDPDAALANPGFKRAYDTHAHLFDDPGTDVRQRLTGVWSLLYLQMAYEHLQRVAPQKKMILGGWGGSNQLPAILRGLDRALPRDIVFSCLNPGMGDYPQPASMAAIAARRRFWSIPWLEGDHALWHSQPRVGIMRDQVRNAHAMGHDGVIAIHWRTEEVRANFAAFARFAADPRDTAAVCDIYRQHLDALCGEHAAAELSEPFARCDEEGWLRGATSPEYYPYTPGWGRLDSVTRTRVLDLLSRIRAVMGGTAHPGHRAALAWYEADLRFTLLLDEVGRSLEPAHALRMRVYSPDAPRGADAARAFEDARRALATAPMEELFSVYASRVRSRGELGVLSSLNQKLYNEYTALHRFLGAGERR